MSAMSITSKERDDALDLLNTLIKCDSEERYDYFYQKLCAMPSKIVEYFNQHWEPIRSEWVRYSLSKIN